MIDEDHEAKLILSAFAALCICIALSFVARDQCYVQFIPELPRTGTLGSPVEIVE